MRPVCIHMSTHEISIYWKLGNFLQFVNRNVELDSKISYKILIFKINIYVHNLKAMPISI